MESVSIEALRAEAVASLYDELGRIRQSRKRKLQELYAVEHYRYIKRSKLSSHTEELPRLGLYCDHDSGVSDELEQKFLDENDIEKGLRFKESTLPNFLSPALAHPPELGTQDKFAPAKAPPQPPSPASTTPSTTAPSVARAKSISPLSPPDTQESVQPVATPQEVAPKPLAVPSPPLARQVTPTATLEVRTNGHHVQESITPAVTPAPTQEKRKPTPEEARTIPPTPSPAPFSQPVVVAAPSSPPEEEKAEQHAEPIAEVDGVPVVKETATEVPNEREFAAGVHFPLAPSEPDRDTQMVEMEAEVPPRPPAPKKFAPSPKKRSPPPPPLALEIPDSQPSPTKDATSPVPSVRTPPTPPQTSQLSPPARLAVITDNQQRRSPALSEKEPQPEVSSPASSIGGSTPGNIISSATSPDPNQIPEPSKPETAVAEDHEKAVEEPQPAEEDEAMEEQVVGKVIEKLEQPTLPSTAVADEIVEQEEEEEVSLPTIPSKELSPTSPARVIEERKEQELPKPIEVEATAPSSPITEVPVSPDPSAQLRLENQLANGVKSRAIPHVPEEHAIALERTKSPVASPKEQQLAPSPAPSPSPSPAPSPVRVSSSPVVVPIADEDEEDEDHVQLVENGVSAIEKAASPVPESPVSIMEPKPQDELEEPVSREPELVLSVEKEPELVPKVEAPAKAQPVAEEAPEEPQPQQSVSEPVEVEAEAEAPPAHVPEAKFPERTMPDSLLIPVDKESEGEEEDEDVVMEDLSSPPKEPSPVVERQPTPEKASAEALDERIAETPKLPDEPTVQEPTVSQVDKLVDGIAVPESLSEAVEVTSQVPEPAKAAEDEASPAPGSPKPPSSIESLSSISETDLVVPTPASEVSKPQAPPTPAETQEEANFVTPALFATPSIRSSTRPKKPSPRAQLSKVVISSAHHAAAAAAAEEMRLREDQEQQGLIVMARRRTQQAAAGAARGRGPSVFPPGSKLEALTRYGVEEGQRESPKPSDYLDPLWVISSYQSPVGELLKRASKTVTTADHNIDRSDRITVKVLKRIEELRSHGLWSFEQIAKAPEPPRMMAHWDYLLKEMDWLAVDFREERRSKIANAKVLVDIVKEFHEYPPERRSELMVDRKVFGRVPKGIREQQKKRRSIADGVDQPTPELMESGGTPEEEEPEEYFVKKEVPEDMVIDLDGGSTMYDHLNEPPPAAVFTLRPDQTSFYMPNTKAARDVLGELPLFAPPAPPTGPEYVSQDQWSKQGLIPVSKYALGHMEFMPENSIEFKSENGSGQKRKRYEFEVNSEPFADDSEEDGEVVAGPASYESYLRHRNRDKTSRPLPLHPEQNNIALFRPEFKPTLQRIRNHIFRPPQDQPPQAFFESRNPSLWTPDEDEKLRLLTKEYAYNWQLVSIYMTMDGEFHSGAERRSPWECFERWMSIENVPADFSKSPWYKSVQQRLEIAQRSSQQHIQAAANGSQHVNQLKRRGTLPTKVDRRRTTRTFTQMEAMRKLAKKRETTMSKQAQSNRAAQVAAMRKQASANPSQLRTPQYFSTMKHEKDVKAMEQKQLMAQMGRLPGGAQPVPPGRLPNGVPIPGQPGRMATPAPGAPMPNGFAAHSSAVRSPGMQHPLQQQYANAMRHPNGAVGLTAQHVAAMRLRAIQQQQMIQQQQQQQQQQMPGMITQADMLARVQQMHPGLTHEQAQLQAQKQVAHYHDQLRNNMAAQVQVRRNSVNVRAGTGGTGVLIGANGPIGPGAAAMAAAQQQQQQQAQQSRSATPVGMAASPRMGQLQQGQQQQQPQPQPAQQQVQSPCPPQPLQQAVGLGVQMSPQPSPAPPQPQPQSQQQ